jgi:hypothetical protein
MTDTFELRAAPYGTVAFIVPPELLPEGYEGEIVQMPLAHPQYTPGDVGNSNAGAFPPKQIFGDYNRTSHLILSSFVQQSWAGGGQKDDSQESSDSDRFARLASLETRFPRALTLLPLTHVITGPNQTGARILGDLLVGGNRQTYVSFGLELHRVSGSTSVSVTTLSVNPVARGVVFRGSGAPLLYIPCGSAGYVTFNGTAASAAITTAKPIWLEVHDKRLWSVDIDGVVSKSLDGATWTTVGTVESDHIPPRHCYGLQPKRCSDTARRHRLYDLRLR